MGPNIKLNLLGLVVGLMLGGGAAFLREMTDDSIHSSEELEKQVALPLLGMTPELAQDKTVSRSSTCLSASRKSWHLGRFKYPMATILGIVDLI